MDVHESLGTDHTDGSQGMWEPPGYDEAGSAGDPHGYDGYDEGAGTDSADGGPTADSSGADDTTATPDDGGTGTETGTGNGAGTMTVEVDGQTRELPAEKDYTGDGQADAVVETADGHVIIFSDTENNETGAAGPDGKADEAYVVDKQTGKVVGAAHIDPSSGTWVEGTDSDGPSAVGSAGGTTDGGTTDGGTTDGGTTTGTTAGTTAGGGTEPDQQSGVVTVEYEGHQVGVAKTIDTDGDGVADSGVLYADGRAVVLTDTDGDPAAEQAAVVDPDTGEVVDVAHVDPETGEWEEGPAAGYGEGGGTGTDGGDHGTGGTGGSYGDDGTGTETTGAGTGTSSGRMTVEVSGQTQQLPAERDYTGDGHADAAVETKDGQVIVFSDTENNETGAAGPDGRADEAWIVDKETGKVVGAAHIDPRTGEWVDGVDTDGPSSVPAGSGGTSS